MTMYKLSKGDYIEFAYTNWKGDTGIRDVIVEGLIYGSNRFHKEEQFLLEAFDIDKKAMRTFAVKDISNVFVWKCTDRISE